MQSNMFIGRLAATPVISGSGDRAVCKFTLIQNVYAGKDDSGAAREKTVSLQFTAFRGRGEAIAKNCMKGDQLIVNYTIDNNNYKNGSGEDVFGYNFNVQEFEFGAAGAEKRKQLNQQSSNGEQSQSAGANAYQQAKG
ncbi:single-stranded DNA-binding protein [Iodobacter fluviatilis]|uniref:Single-stranded DNA-binding protein n=1 Tax=Iodobacter fluviatilis TaxID=537 RepID=A0A7G3GFI0_9NEIS|nr:single-stranded DNA-binding protein [Iodobacter fluviatilis]QBC45872.1 single-stranded DNA-binding protein [Iodobacter fluviatilis]